MREQCQVVKSCQYEHTFVVLACLGMKNSKKLLPSVANWKSYNNTTDSYFTLPFILLHNVLSKMSHCVFKGRFML